MFITGRSSCNRYGEQSSQGMFLILMQPMEEEYRDLPIRGLVRRVKLTQLGHWMMGELKIKDHSITLSGAYGSDGLTRDVPKEVYDLGVDLPEELHEAWNKGGGWNGVGSEASLMKKWAIDHVMTNVQRAAMKRRNNHG